MFGVFVGPSAANIATVLLLLPGFFIVASEAMAPKLDTPIGRSIRYIDAAAADDDKVGPSLDTKAGLAKHRERLIYRPRLSDCRIRVITTPLFA
jgi:hypothetical protein